MVGGLRTVSSIYGRGRGRGRGRGKGASRSRSCAAEAFGMARGKDVARSPSPVASTSFEEDDDVPSVHDSGDGDVKVQQE